MKKIKNSKIYKKIIKFVKFDKEFQISSLSAEISYYMLTSIVSLLLIAVQVISTNYNVLTDFLFLNIFSDDFVVIIKDTIENLNFKGFNVIIVFSIIISSSSILNRYNRLCDRIYTSIEPRKYYLNRLSSVLMFFVLVFVFIIEIGLILYSDKLFTLIDIPIIIVDIIRYLINISILFIFLLLLYMYAPPKKVKVKEAFLGSIIITIILLVFIRIFKHVIIIYRNIDFAKSVSVSLTMFLVFLYLLNYFIILGFFINKRNNGMFNKCYIEQNISEYK